MVEQTAKSRARLDLEAEAVTISRADLYDMETETDRLRAALVRLSDAASAVLNTPGAIADRGDLVGALAQAGRALDGEDG